MNEIMSLLGQFNPQPQIGAGMGAPAFGGGSSFESMLPLMMAMFRGGGRNPRPLTAGVNHLKIQPNTAWVTDSMGHASYDLNRAA